MPWRACTKNGKNRQYRLVAMMYAMMRKPVAAGKSRSECTPSHPSLLPLGSGLGGFRGRCRCCCIHEGHAVHCDRFLIDGVAFLGFFRISSLLCQFSCIGHQGCMARSGNVESDSESIYATRDRTYMIWSHVYLTHNLKQHSLDERKSAKAGNVDGGTECWPWPCRG